MPKASVKKQNLTRTKHHLINDSVRLIKLLHSMPQHRLQGKLKLHKIAYLIQQLSKKRCSTSSFEYEFRYYNFGVYARYLESEVDWLSRETPYIFIKEPLEVNDIWEYQSYLDDDLQKELPSSDDLFGIPEADYAVMVTMLATAAYPVLCLASTIVYVNRINIRNDHDDLKTIVLRVVPGSEKYYDLALEMAVHFMPIVEATAE